MLTALAGFTLTQCLGCGNSTEEQVLAVPAETGGITVTVAINAQPYPEHVTQAGYVPVDMDTLPPEAADHHRSMLAQAVTQALKTPVPAIVGESEPSSTRCSLRWFDGVDMNLTTMLGVPGGFCAPLNDSEWESTWAAAPPDTACLELAARIIASKDDQVNYLVDIACYRNGQVQPSLRFAFHEADGQLQGGLRDE